jgi:hypothetical protein
MIDVVEQLKQTLQGVATLSREQQVVKSQLESDMLPCTGFMVKLQRRVKTRRSKTTCPAKCFPACFFIWNLGPCGMLGICFA